MEQELINQQIRALTWKEPFASMMLLGKIETRTWPTNFRGYVLICSSKRDYSIKSILNICGKQFSYAMNVLTQNKINWGLTMGYAIAIGKLIDCRPMTKDDEEKCFVKYSPNLFCHVYENVRPIKPIIWKGVQGWKIVSFDIIEKIEFI